MITNFVTIKTFNSFKLPGSLWPCGVHSAGPQTWSKQGSFFWVQLHSVRYFFHTSTAWVIGSGYSISFWYDTWGKRVLASSGSRQRLHKISLREAYCSPLWDPMFNGGLPILFNDAVEDELRWRWTPQGVYTAKSAYSMLMTAGGVKWEFCKIWKYSIPPSVRIFIFLLQEDKLLTRDVMHRRNFNCNLDCVMCRTGHSETAIHLFFNCSYSKSVWEKLETYAGTSILVRGNSIPEIWSKSSDKFSRGARIRIRWQTIFVATCWFIWKQRNAKIFENKQHPIDVVSYWIIQEASLWENHCKKRKLKTIQDVAP